MDDVMEKALEILEMIGGFQAQRLYCADDKGSAQLIWDKLIELDKLRKAREEEKSRGKRGRCGDCVYFVTQEHPERRVTVSENSECEAFTKRDDPCELLKEAEGTKGGAVSLLECRDKYRKLAKILAEMGKRWMAVASTITREEIALYNRDHKTITTILKQLGGDK